MSPFFKAKMEESMQGHEHSWTREMQTLGYLSAYGDMMAEVVGPLVEALERLRTANLYMTIYDDVGCDPDVNHHEPECHISADLSKAIDVLNSIQSSVAVNITNGPRNDFRIPQMDSKMNSIREQIEAAAKEYRGSDHNSTGACSQRGFEDGALFALKLVREKGLLTDHTLWCNIMDIDTWEKCTCGLSELEEILK